MTRPNEGPDGAPTLAASEATRRLLQVLLLVRDICAKKGAARLSSCGPHGNIEGRLIVRRLDALEQTRALWLTSLPIHSWTEMRHTTRA